MPAPCCNYTGIEFHNAFWEEVRSCCIYPPDAVFCEPELEWFDADDNPVPSAEGEDGHHIILLWRMDETGEQPQQRPRLYAILAALAHLYSRRVARKDWLQMLMVRYTDTPSEGSDVPFVNFLLWHTSFQFAGVDISLRYMEGREFERNLPPAITPCAEGVHEAAALDWCRLVYEQLEFLLDSIVDAAAYVALKSTLEEWYSYSHQLTRREEEDEARYMEVEKAVHRLPFMPWYPEVLRRMPGLNRLGLCIVPLKSIGRYALLDYRPEAGRRFCWAVSETPGGGLRLAQEGDELLPYDAGTHLHLLPVSTEEPPPCLMGVKQCDLWCFEEDWLWD